MHEAVRAECERKLARIMAKWGDLPTERQISRLDILALKAFASSPWQIVIQEKREELRNG